MTSRNRVLIVDDQHASWAALSFLFNSFGWQTFHANTPEEALQLMTETEFDLLVVDIALNEIEKTSSLLRHVRNTYGTHDPVIFLCTGFIDQTMREDFLAEGAQLILHKPIKSQELHEALKACDLTISVTPAYPRALTAPKNNLHAATVRLLPPVDKA